MEGERNATLEGKKKRSRGDSIAARSIFYLQWDFTSVKITSLISFQVKNKEERCSIDLPVGGTGVRCGYVTSFCQRINNGRVHYPSCARG